MTHEEFLLLLRDVRREMGVMGIFEGEDVGEIDLRWVSGDRVVHLAIHDFDAYEYDRDTETMIWMHAHERR